MDKKNVGRLFRYRNLEGVIDGKSSLRCVIDEIKEERFYLCNNYSLNDFNDGKVNFKFKNFQDIYEFNEEYFHIYTIIEDFLSDKYINLREKFAKIGFREFYYLYSKAYKSDDWKIIIDNYDLEGKEKDKNFLNKINKNYSKDYLNESEFIDKICYIVENIVLKEIDKLNKDEEENNEAEESKGIKEEFDKEIINFVRDFLTRYFGKFYVDVYSVSFSKNSESFLLWNYYANKMTGIVIEYDRNELANDKNRVHSIKDKEIDIEIDIVDIVYDKKNMLDELLYEYLKINDNEYSVIKKIENKQYADENLFQIKDRDKLEESIKKYKNKSFASEEEVRILARTNGRYLTIKNSIKGIIFGKYINKSYKKELIYLLKYINEEKEKDKNRMIEIKEMDIIDGKISFNEIKN